MTSDKGYNRYRRHMPLTKIEQDSDSEHDDWHRLRPLSSSHAANRQEQDGDAVQPPPSDYDTRWIAW